MRFTLPRKKFCRSTQFNTKPKRRHLAVLPWALFGEGSVGIDDPQDEDYLGVFEDEDIQNILRQIIPWEVRVLVFSHIQTNAC